MKMTRKRMLSSSAAFLTVPAFLACMSRPRLAGPQGNDPEANARAQGLVDPILLALNAGITAPNPHNTQAWKFRIQSPLSMQLFIDESRLLPITDPTTRQVHIGQGTLLEVLRLEAGRLGYSARIELFPEGMDLSTAAGKKPVAQVTLIKDTAQDPLAAFIAHRFTNRDEYEGPEITADEFKQILASAPFTLKPVLATPAQKKELLGILNEGMRVESLNRRLAEESRIWFRFNDSEIQTRRDGIALPDQAVTGITRWAAETFFLGPEPEKFFDPSGTEMFLTRYKKKIESARGLVYWKTSANTQKDWVLCGMDYVRFQLALTRAGLFMHPLSQCLQEYNEMAELRRKTEEILGQRPGEKIQMIARVGRSSYRYFTPRRPLKDMIV